MLAFLQFASSFLGDSKKTKKKREDVNDEAVEDSDDGDGEGRELDYISDSTDSEPENINLDGVSEEKALRYVTVRRFLIVVSQFHRLGNF